MLKARHLKVKVVKTTRKNIKVKEDNG